MNMIYPRLPAAWWPDFGPTPSSDSSGVAGICHDISGTDGLAFPPGVEEDMQVVFICKLLASKIYIFAALAIQ